MAADGTPRTRKMHLALAAWIALAMTGCISPSPTPRFFLLSPMAGPADAVASAAPLRQVFVGIGPVDLPDYLDRPQIVTLAGGAEVRLNDFQRWAGPLRSEVPRILAENIAQLLGSDNVSSFPWRMPAPPDWQVAVEIVRFHGRHDSRDLLLEARWVVRPPKGAADPKVAAREQVVEPVAPGGTAALVAAHSRALAELSRRIAAGLITAISGP